MLNKIKNYYDKPITITRGDVAKRRFTRLAILGLGVGLIARMGKINKHAAEKEKENHEVVEDNIIEFKEKEI